MCGRYNVHDDPWLQTLLRELEIDAQLATRVNIAPTEPVPVVFEEDGLRRMREMRWWLVPSWAPAIDTRYSMFNAKAETLATSKAFRGPLRHRRCILPASSFIEWTPSEGRKQPWLIRAEGAAIAFAGLWDVWEKDGNYLESCTIITTDAAPGLERLHRRMPVMLRAEDFARWLDVGVPPKELTDLYRARLPGVMVVATASAKLNDARNKNSDLLHETGIPERVEE